MVIGFCIYVQDATAAGPMTCLLPAATTLFLSLSSPRKLDLCLLALVLELRRPVVLL